MSQRPPAPCSRPLLSPAPHEKGPASRGMTAGSPSSRPSSRGSLSRAGQCLTCSSSNNGSRQNSPAAGKRALIRSPAPSTEPRELPEWGSAVSSYGRECITSAPAARIPLVSASATPTSTSSNRRSTTEGPTESSNIGRAEEVWSKTREGRSGTGCSRPPPGRVIVNSCESMHEFEATDLMNQLAAAREEYDRGRAACHSELGISSWSGSIVQRWLIDMGLDSVAQRCAVEAIDGEALLECTEEDFIKLGVEKLGDRRKLMKHIRLKQAEEADGVDRASSSKQVIVPSQKVNPAVSQQRQAKAEDEGEFGNTLTLEDLQRLGAEDYLNEAGGDNRLHAGNRHAQARSPSEACGAQSLEPSSDNPLVFGNHGRPRRDCNTRIGGEGEGVKGGKGAKDDGGKGGNGTSVDNPLACGNRWGQVRGLPERPPVYGKNGGMSERITWADDPGPSGRAV